MGFRCNFCLQHVQKSATETYEDCRPITTPITHREKKYFIHRNWDTGKAEACNQARCHHDVIEVIGKEIVKEVQVCKPCYAWASSQVAIYQRKMTNNAPKQ